MIPKFRAWDEPNKIMRSNDEIVMWSGQVYINEKKELDSKIKGFSCLPEHLMQSTGLKDKDGVEIFDGDYLHRKVHIIILGTDLNEWVDEIVQVEWKYGGWHVGEDLLEFSLEAGTDRHTGCYQTALGVIGNIYENPELLEAK